MSDGVLHAEDLPVGVRIDLGSHRVGLAELLDFARQWDPQSFHTDPDVAAAGHFGEVIASGIHTLAVFQRLSVPVALGRWAVVAGRRIRDLRFPAPVVADDLLHASLVVEEVGPPRSGRALVVVSGEVRKDDGTRVLSATFETYVRSRGQLDRRRTEGRPT